MTDEIQSFSFGSWRDTSGVSAPLEESLARLGIMDYGTPDPYAVFHHQQQQMSPPEMEEPASDDLQPFARPMDLFQTDMENAFRPIPSTPVVTGLIASSPRSNHCGHSQPTFSTGGGEDYGSVGDLANEQPTSPQDLPVDDSHRWVHSTITTGALTSEQLSSLARQMEEEQQRRMRLSQQLQHQRTSSVSFTNVAYYHIGVVWNG